jgi:hypothetical protein
MKLILLLYPLVPVVERHVFQFALVIEYVNHKVNHHFLVILCKFCLDSQATQAEIFFFQTSFRVFGL